MRKPVIGNSEQVRHKPGCTSTEDGLSGLKLWNKEIEGLYYLYIENKGADQVRVTAPAQLMRAFVLHMEKAGFLMTQLNYDNSLST